MLVTNGGQLIRCPIDGIRIAGRSTQGVTVFKTRENENVVSVERIPEDEKEETDENSVESSDEAPSGEAPSGEAPTGDNPEQE